MFDPSVFTKPDCVAFFEKLNLFNWYVIEGQNIGVRFDGVWKAVETCQDKRQRAAGQLIAMMLFSAMSQQQTRMAKIIRLLSTMVADAPKVFQPTHDLCEYFENVDVSLPISDYEQPFPVVVVRLPQTYVESRNLAFPYVACLFEREHRHLTTMASNLFATTIDSTTITPNEESIESALSQIYFLGTPVEWTQRWDAIRLAERVALNSNLFLVDRGFRLEHMLNGGQRERRKRYAHHAGRRLLPPRELVLTQDVVVEIDASVAPVSEVFHARESRYQKRVHYRRGHWRMQPYGEGRALRKRIFIAPILINAHLDTAKPSERRVIYRTHSRLSGRS